MTIDINLTSTGPWNIVSLGRGIVTEHGHNDSSIPSLINNVLHIASIGEVYVAARTGILIFGLVEDDGPAVCNLGIGNSGRDVGDVAG